MVELFLLSNRSEQACSRLKFSCPGLRPMHPGFSLSLRQAPSAKRQAPSAKRQAPSALMPSAKRPHAKRRAPSAERQAPSARMPHTGKPRQPRVDRRNSNPRRGNWSVESETLRMTHEDEGGCRTPTGPAHRTAHPTTITSILMVHVPKTAATGARQHHPKLSVSEDHSLTKLPREGNLPVYQSTSLV